MIKDNPTLHYERADSSKFTRRWWDEPSSQGSYNRDMEQAHVTLKLAHWADLCEAQVPR